MVPKETNKQTSKTIFSERKKLNWFFPHFVISKNLCGMFHAIYQKNLCNKKVKMVGPPKIKSYLSLFLTLSLSLSHIHTLYTHTHSLTNTPQYQKCKRLSCCFDQSYCLVAPYYHPNISSFSELSFFLFLPLICFFSFL